VTTAGVREFAGAFLVGENRSVLTYVKKGQA
jgi:hypothetical protein